MRAFAPFASLRRFASATPTWIGLALAVAVSPACDLNPNVEACSVTIAPNVITVTVNGAVNVSGTAFDCSSNTIRDKKINFSSANVSVATVTPAGQVIGVSVGQTTVSAVANGKTGTAQVTVTAEQATTVTV